MSHQPESDPFEPETDSTTGLAWAVEVLQAALVAVER